MSIEMTASVEVGDLKLDSKRPSMKEKLKQQVDSEAKQTGEVDPVCAVEEDQSAYALELPENIIGIMIINTLTAPKVPLQSIVLLVLPLAATIAVQVTIALALKRAVNAEAGIDGGNDLSGTCGTATRPDGSYCDPVSGLLVCACVCLFIGVCFGDLKQNVDIFHWLRTFMQRDGDEKFAPYGQAEQLKFHKFEATIAGNHMEYYKPASRMTFFQYFFFVVCLAFQFGVTAWLTWYGSLVILYAQSDLNVILNSVALQFVLDVDELAAKVFADTYSKSLLRATPKVSIADLKSCLGEFLGENTTVAGSGLVVRVVGPLAVLLLGVVFQLVIFTSENGFQCGGRNPACTNNTGCTCNNFCSFATDTDCDDGGFGSEFSSCVLGSDCFDCGPRCVNTTA